MRHSVLIRPLLVVKDVQVARYAAPRPIGKGKRLKEYWVGHLLNFNLDINHGVSGRIDRLRSKRNAPVTAVLNPAVIVGAASWLRGNVARERPGGLRQHAVFVSFVGVNSRDVRIREKPPNESKAAPKAILRLSL